MSPAPFHLSTGNLNFYSFELLGRSYSTQLVAECVSHKERNGFPQLQKTDMGHWVFQKRQGVDDQGRLKAKYVGFSCGFQLEPFNLLANLSNFSTNICNSTMAQLVSRIRKKLCSSLHTLLPIMFCSSMPSTLLQQVKESPRLQLLIKYLRHKCHFSFTGWTTKVRCELMLDVTLFAYACTCSLVVLAIQKP